MNKQKLLEKLKNNEYRNAFVSDHIDMGIPFQIKALREQRDWTQKDLGERAEMRQEAIARLENPDYGKLNLNTLKRLASAFDIGLLIRFVPLSELVNWELNLSPESLQVLSYQDEPYFKEEPAQEAGLGSIIAPGALQGNSLSVQDGRPATSGPGPLRPEGDKAVSSDIQADANKVADSNVLDFARGFERRKKKMERLANALNPGGQSTNPQSLMGAR